MSLNRRPSTEPIVLPPENAPRGMLWAFLVLPACLIVWNVLWAFGIMTGWLALGTALAALFLYRRGSGGRIGYASATGLSAMIVATVVVSLLVGLQIDRMTYGPGVQYPYLTRSIAFQVLFTSIGLFLVYSTTVAIVRQQKAIEVSAEPPA